MRETKKDRLIELRVSRKENTTRSLINTDHEEKLKELGYVNKYAVELTSSCAGPTAEDAKKRRQKEIDGLKDALMILTGEEA